MNPSTIPVAPAVIPGLKRDAVSESAFKWRIDAGHKAHKGTKADVIKYIESCPKIPADAKSYLLAILASFNADAVEVHAHAMADAKNELVTFHIKKLF